MLAFRHQGQKIEGAMPRSKFSHWRHKSSSLSFSRWECRSGSCEKIPPAASFLSKHRKGLYKACLYDPTKRRDSFSSTSSISGDP